MSQPRKKPIPNSSKLLLLDDVVFDILTRVPVKSLIRFRCVSKSLNSTITSPSFITTHLNKIKSLPINNDDHNGFLVYSKLTELCTVVYNSDRILTEISKFKIPFSSRGSHVIGFCNGLFCIDNHILYLWNPSVKKYKILVPPRLNHPIGSITFGLAYHSQNNDFKILRLACYKRFRGETEPAAEVDIYALSNDSWRKVVISVESKADIGAIALIYKSPCLFFNGALYSIACTMDRSFILCFDVNDERFHEIMLPRNCFDEVGRYLEYLVVFKGSLALIVFSKDILNDLTSMCHIWVMRDYGVVESWTKKSVPVKFAPNGDYSCARPCTDNGELLFRNRARLISFEPETLNENFLAIEDFNWLGYTANSINSLVLFDGVNVPSEHRD